MIITSLQEMRWFEKTWGCLIANLRRKIHLFQRPWVCVCLWHRLLETCYFLSLKYISTHLLVSFAIWGWAVNTTLTQLSWEFDAMNVSPVYTFSRHADAFAFIWGCACKKNVIQIFTSLLAVFWVFSFGFQLFQREISDSKCCTSQTRC